MGTSIGFRANSNYDLTSPYFAKRKGNDSMTRIKNQMTSRPFSAKTDFHSFSRNPSSKTNFSNKMLSSHKFINGTPSMKSLTKRPNTAISHGVLRSAGSFEHMKTLNSHYGGAQTVVNMSSHKRNKDLKKKLNCKVNDLIFEATVDKNGVAEFQEIPKTNFVIEVVENDFFKNSVKTVCLAQEAEIEDHIDVYLPLERQDVYTTSVYIK